MNNESIQQAKKMYKSGKLHIYQIFWTNTITGNSMSKYFGSYDQKTAENTAYNFVIELNNKDRYYPANARYEYIGIHDLFNLSTLPENSGLEIVNPPFNFEN